MPCPTAQEATSAFDGITVEFPPPWTHVFSYILPWHYDIRIFTSLHQEKYVKYCVAHHSETAMLSAQKENGKAALTFTPLIFIKTPKNSSSG